MAIGKYIGGEFWSISGSLFRDDILHSSSSNHIRVSCIGDNLTLEVNGVAVMNATDTDLSGGLVGLIAGTFEESGVDILFDNFIVTKP